MIVYIATYPRSGNFWLQTLLGNQFRRPTTNIHVAVESIDRARTRSKRIMKEWFDIDLFDIQEGQFSHYPAEIAEWMLGYRLPSSESNNFFLSIGCKNLVKEKSVRQYLSEDSQIYFLKTHFKPHNDYLPGEHVVQLVRNPGAVIWSYYNFKRDAAKKNKDSDLSTIIQIDQYGNWSEYHQEWLQASKKLGSRYFLAKYEEIAAGELEFCDRLSIFLNLPVLSRELRSFEEYKKIRPSLNRKGKAGGWETNYSKNQLKQLWQYHQVMMKHFGYPEPQYELGLNEEIY